MGALNTTMWQILLYTSFKKLYYIRHWHYTANISRFSLRPYFLSLPSVALQSASHSLTPQQAFISLAYEPVLFLCTCTYRLPHLIPELLPLGLAARTPHPWLIYCPTHQQKVIFLTSLLQHTGYQFTMIWADNIQRKRQNDQGYSLTCI